LWAGVPVSMPHVDILALWRSIARFDAGACCAWDLSRGSGAGADLFWARNDADRHRRELSAWKAGQDSFLGGRSCGSNGQRTEQIMRQQKGSLPRAEEFAAAYSAS